MKTIFKTLMVSALAVAAFGAENRLNFQVEFPFTVGNRVMPAGQYTIRETPASTQGLLIENVQARRSALVALPSRSTASFSAKPKIEFACGDGGCAIASVTNLAGGLRYSSWKNQGVSTRIVAVQMTAKPAAGE